MGQYHRTDFEKDAGEEQAAGQIHEKVSPPAVLEDEGA
jgi:hypothetical protein